MHRPVLVTPPSSMPISRALAKLHCRIDGDDEDDLLDGLIAAAVSHLDGYAGILGRCLMAQSWRQEFDAFAQKMRLPLPATAIASITYTNTSGHISTLPGTGYALQHDAQGSFIRIKDQCALPGGLYQTKAIAITFSSGAALADDVPAAIRQAILLMVGHWYAHRETVVTGTIATNLPMAVDALLAPWRRVGL